jgi:hypothetical protein
VDEGVCPTKGICRFKKFEPRKPKKWGLRLYMICSRDGFLHSFELCGERVRKHALGKSAGIVERLCKIVPSNENFKVYMDSLYTGVPLVVSLAKRGVWVTGTVRANRIPNGKFVADKILMKKGRGAFEEKGATIDGVEVRAVKFYDTKILHMLSTIRGAKPTVEMNRWNKKNREEQLIQAPGLVAGYNYNAHGCDLHNSYVALHRIPVRCRRWYVRFFFFCLDTLLVNAWILHRRIMKQRKEPELSLRKFKRSVANSLIYQNKLRRKTRRTPTEAPVEDVRYDNFGHFPVYENFKARCRLCQRTTKVRCEKCEIPVCFNPRRNHFKEYHTR